MLSNLLRGWEIASVQLAFQVFATDAIDRVYSAADSILIHETGVRKLQKPSIDVLTTELNSIVSRETTRRLGAFDLQMLKNPIIEKDHPRGRDAYIHGRTFYLSYHTSHDEGQPCPLISIFREVKVHLSPRNIDQKTGTEPAGDVARRFEKRTGEIGPLLCDGSGGYSAETMRTHNQPGKSSIDRGADQ